MMDNMEGFEWSDCNGNGTMVEFGYGRLRWFPNKLSERRTEKKKRNRMEEKVKRVCMLIRWRVILAVYSLSNIQQFNP